MSKYANKEARDLLRRIDRAFREGGLELALDELAKVQKIRRPGLPSQLKQYKQWLELLRLRKDNVLVIEMVRILRKYGPRRAMEILPEFEYHVEINRLKAIELRIIRENLMRLCSRKSAEYSDAMLG